jgi:hypothetical protein
MPWRPFSGEGSSITPFLRVRHARAVIALQKVITGGLKVMQQNRAPVVGPSYQKGEPLFPQIGWLKLPFFSMLNIGELRSMQYWDAHNQVSDPTEQRANCMSNLFFDMIDTVSKR